MHTTGGVEPPSLPYRIGTLLVMGFVYAFLAFGAVVAMFTVATVGMQLLLRSGSPLLQHLALPGGLAVCTSMTVAMAPGRRELLAQLWKKLR